MENKLRTLLLVVTIAFERARTEITVKPSDTEVLVGSNISLKCSTSLAKDVHWYHYPAEPQPSVQKYIYAYHQWYVPYKDRFQLYKNESSGSYDIFIPSVELTDAGVYVCQDNEGNGDIVSAELIVLEDFPTCSSNMKQDGVVGVNSCNMEPEKLKLSCSVSYCGKNPPLMEWRNINGNTSITKGVTTETAVNRITSHLTMTGEPSMDGSSYVCQTTKAHYHCISNAIKVIYAISSKVVKKVMIGDTVICQANASQGCTYKWKWFRGDDTLTASNNQTLIPKQSGDFRCEAECPLREQPCTITAMLAYVESSNETSITSESNLSTGAVALIVCMVLLVLIAIIVLVACLIYRRRRLFLSPQNVKGNIPMEETEKLLQVFDNASDASDFSKLSSQLPYVDKGSSGEVYGPCQYRNKTCAFQRILYPASKLSTDVEKAQREIVDKGNRWKELEHPNIVKFYAVRFETPALYLLMEYAAGGTVRKALDLCGEDLPSDVITNWALQIASGMEYLHAKDIVHSHLKSAQVLIMESFDPSGVSNKTLKIASYRISRESAQSAPGSYKGMFAWESPESIQMQTFSKARDIWSYGVTLWEILTRKIPYTGVKNAAIIQNVLAGNKGLTIPMCSAVLQDIMSKCWTIEPDKRPSFSDIVSTLKGGEQNLMAISDGGRVPEGITRMPYIDKGCSGEVFGPFFFQGRKCACERIMYSPAKVSSAIEDICDQGKRWMKLDHRNLLKFYDVRFQVPTLYVVMDYADGGSVRKALDVCTEDLEVSVVKDWATQIADGMNYLHSENIVHGRLKCAQVLIMEPFDQRDSSKKTLKIASYRLATDGQSVPVSFKGMFAWMAPETIKDSEKVKASDVWSYGVTVWEILTKSVPYKDAKQAAIIRNVLDGNPNLDIPNRCPDTIRKILKECWMQDMKKRPTFSEILSRLHVVADC